MTSRPMATDRERRAAPLTPARTVQAQEQDALSDMDFESDDDEEMEEADNGDEKPPQKKRKA